MRSLNYSVLAILVSLMPFLASGQDAKPKRELITKEIQSTIKIDGNIDEPAWQEVESSSEFIQTRPNPGDKPRFDTKVWVLYDQKALYVAMEMYDPQPDSILKQLSQRDNIGNTSFAGLCINGFSDGINGFEFFATVEGVQFDAALTTNGEDPAWNAVWNSATRITENGWNLEMSIPYSAIRFPEKDVQEWDINFVRTTRRFREQSFWNFVDPGVAGFANQFGVLKGVENIQPPTRLFFYPYMGYNVNLAKDDDGNQSTGTELSGGMDLKYGINNSYTLDMTLVPDFSQVRNDDNVLNLTPFEVRFNENRQFFTEGTELFNKGDLFYSRRIGARPINRGKAFDLEDEGYEIVDNPGNTRLLNAIKVSGRNKKGLGVGVFNAVTNRTQAELQDSLGNTVMVETAPLTNYSVVVFDQNLKNNSYITLVNTNVMRDGSTYDANVVGTVFDIRNKGNVWGVNGAFKYNYKFNYGDDDANSGQEYNLGISKLKGMANYGVNYRGSSEHFDANDLGFTFFNNYKEGEIWFNYDHYKPTNTFNNYWFYTDVDYTLLSSNNEYSNMSWICEGGANTKKFHAFGGGFDWSPLERHDYYETRDFDQYFARPRGLETWAWISSDYRREFALDANIGTERLDMDGWVNYWFGIGPRWRVNDKLSLFYRFNHNTQDNQRGYTTTDSDMDRIIFGKRDVETRENIFSAEYVFNNRMGLTARLRHYWRTVVNDQFFALDDDGELQITDFEGFEEDGTSDYDRNFNAITSDVAFRWVFDYGSEVSLVWKSTISGSMPEPRATFSDNFNRAIDLPGVNSFSVRILYFLDYLSLKKSKAVTG